MGTPVTWRVAPWFLDEFSDRGNTVANQSCTTKKILRDAILVSILNSQQSRRTVTSKLKMILVTSRMPSRSLDEWCDRGNVVPHQSKKQTLSSEIRYQFKSELSSPSSCGERSKTSWQVKTVFSWFSTWFSTCFSKKNMKVVLKGFPIKSWPSGSYLIWWYLQNYQSVFDEFFFRKILRFYSTTSACF